MDTTNEQKGPFDWHEFPEGRARFIGGVRGSDELRHEGFAIKINGFPEMYGEIREKSDKERHGFCLEIVSYGWPGSEWLGMPIGGMIHRFDDEDLSKIRSLILELVDAVRRSDDRPFFLKEYESYKFLGSVIFLDGWVVIRNGGADHD